MGPFSSDAWLGTAAGRVSAGAAAGALIGLGCSLATRPPRRRRRGQPFGAIGRVACMVVLGPPAAAAACWACLAAAGLGPLTITVPAAAALLILTALTYLAAVPGGRLRPAWLFALATGVTFAMLAAMTTPGYRITGAVSLTVLAAAGLLGRHALHSFLSRRARERSLARLTMPLPVPDLPGYQLLWAHPAGCMLTVELAERGRPAGWPGGRAPQIGILLAPVPAGFAPPAAGPDVQPSPAIMAGDGPVPWLPAGPGQWTRRGRDVVQLTERRGSTLITASGRTDGVSPATLTDALSSLRPSTPSDLAAMSGAATAGRPD